jgi:two-component system, NarL family, sensor kinase
MGFLSEDISLIFFASIFLIVVAVGIIILILLYQKRQLSHFNEKNQMRSNSEKELLRTQLEIQEQTLKTISQEIHDNIGQVLSLTKLNLNTIDFTKPAELQEKITDSKNLVSKAIHDLRDLSKSLNTDNIAAMGLVRVIEYELEMIRKTGFATLLEVTGDTIKMEPQKELILFRIVQETLNNIIKHAEAKRITVIMTYSADKLELQVQDNGKGTDLSSLNDNADSSFGLGIRNMHNRAKLIGAEFTMSSSIGKGTVVSVIVPLNNHNL